MGQSLNFERALHPLLQQRIESIIKSCKNPEQLKTASNWVNRLKLNESDRLRLQGFCSSKNLQFHIDALNNIEWGHHGLST